ncbi:MFS transporter [Aliidiomarina sp. Khilg15.8]
MPNPAPKREIFGWAMYDVANQAYTTVVISFIYSAFFVGYIVPSDSALRDSYWSLALISSTLVAMVLSPIVGQRIDQGASKKRLLAISTLVCATFTSALWFVSPGDVWLGVALIVVTNTAWMLGEAIISAFLPEISTRRNMGLVSGIGWGLGYLGGLISMVLVTLLIVTADATSNPMDYIRQNQWAMVAISVYFVLFAVPTFVLLKERPHVVSGRLYRQPWYQSLNLRLLMRSQPILLRFLMAFVFYMAGVQTVIKFIGIYATGELGLTQADLISVFLATQLSAMAGALGFGFVEHRIGARPTLFIVIVIWLLAISAMYGLPLLQRILDMDVATLFLGVALLAGTGIGAIQSSSRSLVGQLTAVDKGGSAFGWWGVFNRLAMLLAATFGLVADVFSRQQALLMVLGFFVLGAILLARVPLAAELRRRYADDKKREQ